MRVLIFGGLGFLGREIIRKLTEPESGFTIINTTSREAAAQNGVRYINYESKGAIRKLLEHESPSVVLHLASSCLGNQTESAFGKGIVRDENILEALLEWGGEVRLIFVASMACFGATEKYINPTYHNPETYYGKEKTRMVYRLKDLSKTSKNIDVKIVFPSSIYGKGQRGKMFLPSLLNHLHKDMKMSASGSKKRRDYIHVSDVGQAIAAMIKDFDSYDAVDIFLNSGKLVELGVVAAMVSKIVGRDVNDIVHFKDFISDENDYQCIIEDYKSPLDGSDRVSLDEGLMEIFLEA